VKLPRDFYELPVFIGNVLAWLSSVGFVFLASVPIVLCGAFRRGRHRPLMVASLGLVLMWFAMMQNTRYLIPALAVLVPAIAGSAEMIRGRKVMTAVAAIMAIFTAGLLLSFVLPALPAVVGTQSRDEYLEQRLDIYRASKFINESKGKAALLGETRGFYIDQDYVWADPDNNPAIPYGRMGGDPNKLLDWLRSEGINYVLVNRMNFPNAASEPSRKCAALIGRAIDNGLDEAYSTDDLDPARSIVVYHVSR
jgi:hypothetical protein